eukprot:406180-Amphidinium_carterae.1
MITWPIGIKGNCGEIQSLELPNSEIPLLLSRQAQESLGFVIRTQARLLDIGALSLADIPLDCSDK